MASGDDARLTRFVTNLYYGALQRDPTSTELQNGVNQLAAAGAQGQSQLLTTASQMARGLFTQSGYETSPYRSDIQYVADLYYTYLQRGPDDGGLNWWAGQVASNGRGAVCNAFEGSAEFQTLVSTVYGTAISDNQRTENLVNNFYRGAYGRDATSTEIQTQRDALNAAAAQGLAQVQAQVETMGRSLFAGQVTDYSISDQQFVTNLYEAFLQRGPDAGGLGFWTSIASGGSANRQNVLGAFAGSGSAHELAGTLYREAYWLVNDRLGTPRMIVDKSGSLASVRRHDYLPFGEELYAGTGGRTTTQGYSGDSTREKFTGYEYDAETGLNFAQARYQSSVQGRFTSVDPLPASATVTDPQSLNRYSYVQNNPTNFTDPTGLRLSDIGVYQTANPEVARKVERAEDQGVKNWIARPPQSHDHAANHGGPASTSGGEHNRSESDESGQSPQNSSGVTVPTDENDRAMLANLLGEASTPGEGSSGPDEYGPKAFKHPSRVLSAEEVRDEMLQMIAVVNNRLNDTGDWKQYGYKSWKDVVEAPGQFAGYGNGQNILKNLGSNGDTQVERARLAVSAIKDFHEAPFKTPFFYWRGIKQDLGRGPFVVRRDGAFRLANTDFLIKERK